MEMTQRPSSLDALERRLKQAKAEAESLSKKVNQPGGDRTASACLDEIKAQVRLAECVPLHCSLHVIIAVRMYLSCSVFASLSVGLTVIVCAPACAWLADADR